MVDGRWSMVDGRWSRVEGRGLRVGGTRDCLKMRPQPSVARATNPHALTSTLPAHLVLTLCSPVSDLLSTDHAKVTIGTGGSRTTLTNTTAPALLINFLVFMRCLPAALIPHTTTNHDTHTTRTPHAHHTPTTGGNKLTASKTITQNVHMVSHAEQWGAFVGLMEPFKRGGAHQGG